MRPSIPNFRAALVDAVVQVVGQAGSREPCHQESRGGIYELWLGVACSLRLDKSRVRIPIMQGANTLSTQRNRSASKVMAWSAH